MGAGCRKQAKIVLSSSIHERTEVSVPGTAPVPPTLPVYLVGDLVCFILAENTPQRLLLLLLRKRLTAGHEE